MDMRNGLMVHRHGPKLYTGDVTPLWEGGFHDVESYASDYSQKRAIGESQLEETETGVRRRRGLIWSCLLSRTDFLTLPLKFPNARHSAGEGA